MTAQTLILLVIFAIMVGTMSLGLLLGTLFGIVLDSALNRREE